MKHATTHKRQPLKRYAVAYYIEQGFTIIVNAASATNAKRIVINRLNDICDVLEGSTRVHYDGLTLDAEEVRS